MVGCFGEFDHPCFRRAAARGKKEFGNEDGKVFERKRFSDAAFVVWCN